MNEVNVKLVRVNKKNLKAVYSAIAVGAILLLGGTGQAALLSTPLPLRCEPNGVQLHNCVTSQTLEAAYGTSLQGLAFTKTTTYDFYSQPVSADYTLAPGDHGGGRIYAQNNSADAKNDVSVSGQMQFFDYNPATGSESLILDTTASQAKQVKHGTSMNWAVPNTLAPKNLTIPAGHLIHVALTIGLVSGDPGNSVEMLYNGPSGSSTVAYLPKKGTGLSLAPILAAIPLPTNTIMGLLPNHCIRITGSGMPGASCLIQATTDLSKPASWVTISTNVVGLDGVLSFIDQDAMNHSCRFYRFAAP